MTNAPAEILTPDSDRWSAFFDALDYAVEVNGCDGDHWDAGPNTHRLAKRVMTEMGNVDIPESIAYFQNHGGYCDCEILMNVDRRVLDSHRASPPISDHTH